MHSFDPDKVQHVIHRIHQLTPTTTPQWGKMSVDQMLAHLNVAYDMCYTSKYAKPNFIAKWLLKLFVKEGVVGPKPYPKNSRTAPDFIIRGRKDFGKEKDKLISYIEKTRDHGQSYFEGKESHSFGPLTAQEWDTLFYKHLDHHLVQFGV